jgi:hypothetical protein
VQIDKHNSQHAVRLADLIDVAETRRPRYRGKGATKRWLPSAVLRSCFGVRRSIGKPSSSWFASSTRVCADVFQGSHCHVQRTRQSVSMAAWRLQQQRLRDLPSASHGTLEISFDETEMPVKLNGRQSERPIFMIHAVLHWTTIDGATAVYQLALPPCVLMSKKAEAFYSAIHQRLPISLADLKRKCISLAVIILTDSARSCIRLSRCFRAQTAMSAEGAGVVSVWMPCLMHRAALAVFSTLKLFDLMVPLFCGTVLLHQGQTFELILPICLAHIASQLELVFHKPPGYDLAKDYLTHLLSTLEFTGEGEVESNCKARQTREDSREWLAKALAASTFDSHGRLQKLRHWCPFGCCGSREEAIRKIQKNFETAVWWSAPTVPACNRWTKMFPPLTFWNVVDKLGFPAAAVAVVGGSARDVDTPIADVDVIGPGDDNTYERKKRARFKKTVDWLGRPSSS